MIGYAFCGSYCTHASSLLQLEGFLREGYEIQTIVSENVFSTDTRFGRATELITKLEALTGRAVIHSIVDAEPLGPKISLDALIIAPCTGNTLAKLANGITDTAVTMACKSHLRNARPLVLAVSTNDALGNSARNIGALLNYKNIYFVPMRQDDCVNKPRSVVADFSQTQAAIICALDGKQVQPIFV